MTTQHGTLTSQPARPHTVQASRLNLMAVRVATLMVHHEIGLKIWVLWKKYDYYAMAMMHTDMQQAIKKTDGNTLPVSFSESDRPTIPRHLYEFHKWLAFGTILNDMTNTAAINTLVTSLVSFSFVSHFVPDQGVHDAHLHP